MEHIFLRNPGVGAIELEVAYTRILVDAFNSVNEPAEIRDGDIILFTHDDADHFDPSRLPDLSGRSVTVIGPPTIVKPVLDAGKAAATQIIPAYSQNNAEPWTFTHGDICIKSFSTSHFMNWKPVHNSYMISHSRGSIYLTGDSYLTKDLKDIIGRVDIVVCNLVDEGYIKRRDDPRFAVHHHLSYMLNIMSDYKPKRIIGAHLIGFDGTVDPGSMKKLVNDYGFKEIVIPSDNNEVLGL